mmetsp:Transcript_30514/g.29914  ORF Transcript_30514/g.29914 Transcript_30514/m.29914 type:complete len:105 (+) Transcript_30514:472-786(+)
MLIKVCVVDVQLELSWVPLVIHADRLDPLLHPLDAHLPLLRHLLPFLDLLLDLRLLLLKFFELLFPKLGLVLVDESVLLLQPRFMGVLFLLEICDHFEGLFVNG